MKSNTCMDEIFSTLPRQYVPHLASMQNQCTSKNLAVKHYSFHPYSVSKPYSQVRFSQAILLGDYMVLSLGAIS